MSGDVTGTAAGTGGWLAVVSAEHVERSVDLGIVQTNHGRRTGLARMSPGETVVCYSPTRRRGDATPLRHLTALGTVADDEIWQADEGAFQPHRRRVAYLPSHPVPLADVRDRLHLTAAPHWGVQLRRGLVRLDVHDVELVREAMTASPGDAVAH